MSLVGKVEIALNVESSVVFTTASLRLVVGGEPRQDLPDVRGHLVRRLGIAQSLRERLMGLPSRHFLFRRPHEFGAFLPLALPPHLPHRTPRPGGQARDET